MRKKKDMVFPDVARAIKQERRRKAIELAVTIISSVVGALLGILLMQQLG